MTPAPEHEPTTISPGLIGFYAGVGTASLGGAVAAVGWVVFAESEHASTVGTIGLVMVAAGFVAALRCLKAARGE